MKWGARQGAPPTAHRLNWLKKNDDRLILNKIEGVNRSRGEAGETVHHLYMAKLKSYISDPVYREFQGRYKECIRMLNGLEKTLERKAPEKDRRWQVAEASSEYSANTEMISLGWPIPLDT